ncbi:hypothetical protein LCGC14_2745310 [marine sediment metagenome]|uniref:HVO-0163 N-terminal HTH domain-containing protein n=1 Tax=marine sediment metagenome TaxID=412755 RepID=A0A0F9BUY6_9ZZZZ
MKKSKKIFIIFLIFVGILTSLISFLHNLQMDKLRFREEGISIEQVQSNNDLIIDSSYEIVFDNSIDIYDLLLNNYNPLFTTAFSIGTPLLFIIPTLFSNFSRSDKIKVGSCLEIEGVKINGEEINVFIFIQEFLNHNRVFSKEKAAQYIKSRYDKANGNLNHNGIKAVINSLMEKNIIVEGSKLTRNEILLNSNRKQIYDFIIENPGVHRNKLARKVDLSTYLIKWHVSMLIKFNLIREQKLSNFTAYFDSSLRQENDLLLHTISRDKCVRIINFLEINKEGSTKNQISKELNMHFNTISNYLKKMDKFSLLERKKVNNIEYISLNDLNFKLLKQKP